MWLYPYHVMVVYHHLQFQGDETHVQEHIYVYRHFYLYMMYDVWYMDIITTDIIWCIWDVLYVYMHLFSSHFDRHTFCFIPFVSHWSVMCFAVLFFVVLCYAMIWSDVLYIIMLLIITFFFTPFVSLLKSPLTPNILFKSLPRRGEARLDAAKWTEYMSCYVMAM